MVLKLWGVYHQWYSCCVDQMMEFQLWLYSLHVLMKNYLRKKIVDVLLCSDSVKQVRWCVHCQSGSKVLWQKQLIGVLNVSVHLPCVILDAVHIVSFAGRFTVVRPFTEWKQWKNASFLRNPIRAASSFRCHFPLRMEGMWSDDVLMLQTSVFTRRNTHTRM